MSSQRDQSVFEQTNLACQLLPWLLFLKEISLAALLAERQGVT